MSALGDVFPGFVTALQAWFAALRSAYRQMPRPALDRSVYASLKSFPLFLQKFTPASLIEAGLSAVFVMLAPFDSARIKLARANEHIQDLETKIRTFFGRDGAHIVLELADEYTKAVGVETAAFVYRQKDPVPAMWSAIIGDAIHNLRASLDLLVSDLHRLTGGDPKDTAHVHYPFCKEKDALQEMIRSRRLSRIGHDFISLIEQTAPYKGGNDGLRAIHDLDLLDKHQTLVATVSVVQMDWPVPVADGTRFTTGVAQDGQRLVIIPRAFVANFPLGFKINADFSIVFGKVGPFEGSDVIKQLQACAASITFIVGLFADLAEKKALLSPRSANA